MTEYRVYCVTVTGKAGRGDFIEAETDQEAVEAVRRLHPHSNCELWDDDRLVAKVPATASLVTLPAA